MKKKILISVAAAIISAGTLSSTVFAETKIDRDFIRSVGDVVEPYDLNGNSCGYRFEIIKAELIDGDIIYTMQLTDSEYNIIVQISDSDLWEMGYEMDVTK